jgi:S-(hydroxymethyl)glutathione dehydrogenase/alcohol dehydrogenase
VLRKLNSPLDLVDIRTNSLTRGQVLIRIVISGLCGAQLQEIGGHKGNEKFLPHLLGHEGFGEVVATGPDVSKVRVGQKVVMHWRKGSGIESDFPQYQTNHDVISGGKITTLSEFSVVSENRITPIGDDVDPELAALMGCSLSTAFSLVEKQINKIDGMSILILGAGGLGQSISIALSSSVKCETIFFDYNHSKFDLVNNLQNEFIDDLQKILDRKFDVIIDTIGDDNIFTNAINLLNPSGEYFLIAQPIPNKSLIINNADKLFEGNGKKIIAVQGGDFYPDADLEKYIKQIKNKSINYTRLITHRFKLKDINNAIECLKTGSTGRVMIEMK